MFRRPQGGIVVCKIFWLTSWLLVAGAGALGFAKASAAYAAVVVIGWIVCQVLGTIILSIEEKADGGDSAVSKEKDDAKPASGARRDAGG